MDRRLRNSLREQGKIFCALSDFDLSMMLPPDTQLEDCRLSISESWKGLCDRPPDVQHGELDFNPFAYDVICLGMHIAYVYQVRLESFFSHVQCIHF